MRQIKFRAYHNRAQKILESGTNRQVFAWQDEGQDITIMQFTGLCDKNGKEIYEGDIVLSQVATPDENFNPILSDPMPGVIQWDDTFGGWSTGEGECLYTVAVVEVIGNIYEHPHLLNPER